MANSLAEMLAPLFAPALQLVAVASRGEPGQERVYIRANKPADLREYLLIVGLHIDGSTAFPSPDHVLWLGNEHVETGTWIIIYTGLGQRTVTHITETREPALVLYWGRNTTLFHDERIVPILARMDMSAVQVGVPGS
jgi:hypothetical protein